MYAQKTDSYDAQQFQNENKFKVMTGEQQKSSDRRIPKETIKADEPDFGDRAGEGELTVTWLGHSSLLLQLGLGNILIDPVLGEYSSPVAFAGPKRFSECPVTVDDLPEIDALFISHDHYDHLEYETIRSIDEKVKHYIVPLGIDYILKGWDVPEEKITALCWWEEVSIDGISYTLTPAQHYTGRNPLKMNRTLWGGVYLSDGIHKVYYTGDSGYYDVFSRVYEKYGKIDLMIADAGQYDTGWKTTHMFPEQTVQAAGDAHAKWLIPVHWGAFSLANHSWDDPIIRAVAAAEDEGINLATPCIGQTVDYDTIATYTEHWWEGIR